MIPTPRPFVLNVPQAQIDDLRDRLGRTRFPDPTPGEAWACGTDVGWLQSFVEYWRDQFDWRMQEARLNALPQYKVALHGIDLHYLHVPGRGPNPCPLLLSHGWPGSVFEFLEMIPRLTDPARFGGDPADAFTVVVPSLPGFGLSFRPGQPRLGIEAIADCFDALMVDVLGYSCYAAQGGDWGACVTSRLAVAHAENLLGIHLNLLPIKRDPDMSVANQEEAAYVAHLRGRLADETGYQVIQSTRPQTLAFGLTDSPAGLAAWIIEKFRAWSDCDGDVESSFCKDTLLANIALYWFTGSIGTSFWPYYACRHGGVVIPDGEKITVPTGHADFPSEPFRKPRSVAEVTFLNLVHWTSMPRGGHFAPMERPADLAQDIMSFFRGLRLREH